MNYEMTERAEITREKCPGCGDLMIVVPIGNGPDNYANYLICQYCGYQESE